MPREGWVGEVWASGAGSRRRSVGLQSPTVGEEVMSVNCHGGPCCVSPAPGPDKFRESVPAVGDRQSPVSDEDLL